MSRIFLSHSSQDDFVAIALKDWLKEEGWDDVFLDLDPARGIVAGERWERKLHEAARRCEAVIFLISRPWLESGWCRKEYALARGLNKKLFGVVIDPGETIASLPEELTDAWQVVDLVHRQDMVVRRAANPDSHAEAHVAFSREGLARLKAGLEKAGLDARFFAWPPADEPTRAPYRGLKPFEAVDAGIFFGRDAPIVVFVDALRGLRAAAPPRLLALLGASGAGKSSFLRAGLLPRLARDDSQFLPLKPIRPGRAALSGDEGLLAALEAAFPDRPRAELRAAMAGGAAGLRPLLADLAAEAHKRTLDQRPTGETPTVVIAIDQAEELFRPESGDEGAALLKLIGDLAVADAPATIAIFSIRSDAYDALQNAKAFEGLPQLPLSLPPMPRNAYREVIEGPARRVVEAGGKLTVEPRLAERLLEDVESGGGKDALPLIAFTLEQLYREYGRAGALRLADYEAMGGLKGAIDAAVERAFVRADSDPRVPSARAQREALLRRGLIPWLAGVDPEAKKPRRNIARRSDIPPESAPLIELMIEERLLSADSAVEKDAAGREVRVGLIEPTHEALLRQWGRLAGWLEEDFALLATLEGVKRASRDWDANARAEAWLAHQGERLAAAEGLDARADVAARLDATDRAYLALCRAKEEARRAEEERRRREREAEQARRLADAQALAAANRRVAVIASVGLVIAVLLAGAASFLWRQAKNNADAAVEALTALIQTTSEVVRPIATLDTVDALITEARDAMDRFSSFSVDPRVAEQRARSLLLLAEIDWERGDLKRMGEEARQAFALLDGLAAGGDAEFRLLRAESRHLVGLAVYDQGDKAGALADYQAAIAELNDLAKANLDAAAEARRLAALADVEQDLGDDLLIKFNQPDQGLAAYDACYDERVAAEAKGDNGPAMETDVAWALNKHGDVAVREGRDDDAQTWFAKARDRVAALGDELWTNPLWPDRLAVIDNNIGLLDRAHGDFGGAIASFGGAAKLLTSVVARDPKNLYWRTALSWTDYILAEAELRQALAAHDAATLKQARDGLAATVGQFSEVVNAAPDKPQWRVGLLGAEAHLDAVDGFTAQWAGDDQGAEADFAKAAALYADQYLPQIDQSPRPDFASDTVEFLDWAALAAAKLGRADEARADLQRAEDALDKYRALMGARAYANLAPRVAADLAALGK